jgi:hypothetical protein
MKGTLDAPAEVDPGGAEHIVVLVPACGARVAARTELEAESPAGLGVAGRLVPGVGVALPAGAGVEVGVWEEDAAVDVDVTGAGDCDVLSWLVDMLATGGRGLTGISG